MKSQPIPSQGKILETVVQKEVCEWLERRGFFFWRVNNTPMAGRPDAAGNFRFRRMPKYTPRGVPDIIVVRRGLFIGIEVKRPKAKLSEHQVRFGADLIKHGGSYYKVSSIEELEAIPELKAA